MTPGISRKEAGTMTLDDVDVAGVLCPARVALSQGFACAGDGGRSFDQGRKSGVGESVNGLKADISVLAGAEPAALDDGTALSMSQLARLACDSSIGRIVLSATGEVLDAGRSKRLFTPGQTRAVIARDRTCRYPGCSETIQHGQIHHALPWKKGGATDLANAVLLCWHHHALVHREMTTVAHHDGGFVFTRPDGTIIGTRRHGV